MPVAKIRKPPAARVEAIIARNAAVAVIFRRGRSRWVRMLKWNLRNDRIEPGQWIEARVHVGRSDISPSGNLVACFVASYRKMPGTWTAISRHKGDVLWSRAGKLFRLAGPARQGMKIDAEPKLVADLNDMTFEAIEAPRRATKWP
jgi:hypothetical protein